MSMPWYNPQVSSLPLKGIQSGKSLLETGPSGSFRKCA